MKIADIKDASVKVYRRYSLRKDTPELYKALYVERKGSLSQLKLRFGQEEVQKNLYLSNIKKLSNDKWQTTESGIGTIKVFYSKQGPFQMIKNILFGILSRPFR